MTNDGGGSRRHLGGCVVEGTTAPVKIAARGLERHFGVLMRSDHAPFWEANMPAVMWTDTSEFRNPNYHKLTDTPDTLDYPFLRAVTTLLTVRVLATG